MLTKVKELSSRAKYANDDLQRALMDLERSLWIAVRAAGGRIDIDQTHIRDWQGDRLHWEKKPDGGYALIAEKQTRITKGSS